MHHVLHARFSKGQDAEITVIIFRSYWVKYDYIGSKKAFGRLQSNLTQLDRKRFDVISGNWAPGLAGNSPRKILENAPTHSVEGKAIFSKSSGQRLPCEPAERYIFNGLQI